MNRRAAIASVVTVTLVFFAIRLGIRLLSREVVPGASTEVGNPARGGPTALPSRQDTKAEALAKLQALASEAREAKDTKAATAAYAAKDAINADDCEKAKPQLARAGETLPKDHHAFGAFESAQHSVDAYCLMTRD